MSERCRTALVLSVVEQRLRDVEVGDQRGDPLAAQGGADRFEFSFAAGPGARCAGRVNGVPFEFTSAKGGIEKVSVETPLSEGVARLDFGGRPPDAVIVGEPTENRPVVGHKAHLWFELTVRGKAAHGSHPEAGDNAIYRMAAVIASLRRFTESRLNRDTARENAKLKIPFTPATLSVGTIRGGTKVNIVPDACAILVDVRLLPWQVPAAMLEELADWVRADSGQPLEITWTAMAPGFASKPDSALARAIAAAAENCGVRTPPGVVNYCTDAGAFGAAGLDTVVFGPGSILQAHAAEEYIELAQLDAAVEILTETARHYAGARQKAEG
jgi:acetylornithine deacetylase/succinyl-diaminopimelate desuccinylase-like protein